jgi:hypothetical protein
MSVFGIRSKIMYIVTSTENIRLDGKLKLWTHYDVTDRGKPTIPAHVKYKRCRIKSLASFLLL